jgi:translation initiation factor 4G
VLRVLQGLSFDLGHPKGFFLRVCKYLYDVDIVEEDAFMAWRDLVDDVYPGKGEALVAVNEFLNWMATADDDDDEDDE